MQDLFQTLQPYIPFIVIAALVAAFLALGSIKPVGKLFARALHMLGLGFASVAELLKPFTPQQSTNKVLYGLRTIVLVIAGSFAAVATVADGFLTQQALVPLTDDKSLLFTLPPCLSWLNLSQGWLFISLSAITGMILLETKFGVVPESARIFEVPKDAAKKAQFEWFILITFVLSLVATILFNALKPAYIADSESIITLVLRATVMIVLGALLPCCMALTIYMCSLAVHAVFSLAMTITFCLAAMLTRMLGFLVTDFTPANELRTFTQPSDLYKQYITPGQGGVTTVTEEKVLPDPAVVEEEKRKKPEKQGKVWEWNFNWRIGKGSKLIPLTPEPAASPDPSILKSGSNGNGNNGHGNNQNGPSTASPQSSDELPQTYGMKHAEVVEPDPLFSAQDRHILDCMARGLPINQIMTEVYGISKAGSDYQKKLPELRAAMQRIAQYASNKLASN